MFGQSAGGGAPLRAPPAVQPTNSSNTAISTTQPVDDHNVRSVLLKQDAAQRILRIQQQQLQPRDGGDTAGSGASARAAVLVDKVSQLEKEREQRERDLYALKLRVSELQHLVESKDALLTQKDAQLRSSAERIQQLQWSVDAEKDTSSRLQGQLEAFRSEITRSLLEQMHNQQQQLQQLQPTIHQQQGSPPAPGAASPSEAATNVQRADPPAP